MKYASFAFALCFLASTLDSSHVLAATLSTTLSVSATVVSSCRASAPATAFGTYSATGTNATSSVSVNCTNPTAYDVSYSTSQAPNATAIKRNTDDPATDSLGHSLLSNSAYNVNRGRAAGAYAMPGTARGSSHPYASYGQAAGAHPVAPGAFADSVMISVTY